MFDRPRGRVVAPLLASVPRPGRWDHAFLACEHCADPLLFRHPFWEAVSDTVARGEQSSHRGAPFCAWGQGAPGEPPRGLGCASPSPPSSAWILLLCTLPWQPKRQLRAPLPRSCQGTTGHIKKAARCQTRDVKGAFDWLYPNLRLALFLSAAVKGPSSPGVDSSLHGLWVGAGWTPLLFWAPPLPGCLCLSFASPTPLVCAVCVFLSQ